MAAAQFRCATIGCRNTATKILKCSFPENRDKTEIAAACGECAQGYSRRPALKASVHPLETMACTGCQHPVIVCRDGPVTLTADWAGLPHRCREEVT